MSKNMSFIQLGILLRFVHEYHGPFSKNKYSRNIKYVDPHIDMRTGECFSITFRTYGGECSFYTTNEFRDAEPLYNRCIEWLDELEKANATKEKEGTKA